jgi:acetylornithine aminotransferase
MESEDVPARARSAGKYLTEGLAALPGVKSVRGLGLLIAAELEEGKGAAQVMAAALDSGLVVNAVTPTALRLAPSLLVTEAEIDEAVSILGRAIGSVGAA